MKKKPISAIVLRKEIDCMIECYLKELFSVFNKKDVLGIYLLGSVNKPRDSDIDYIPEFSDVDINVYVKDPKKFNKYFSDMKKALQFSKNVERKYLKKIPKPYHIPKLQAQLHNIFKDAPDYLPPAATVKTLYGIEYIKTVPKSYKKSTRLHLQILHHEQFLSGIPVRIMSANSKGIIKYTHEFYWRVCSSVLLVSCISGLDLKYAASLNKSSIIKELKAKGLGELSSNYESMLKNSLEQFLTGDPEYARKAILFGYKALKECIKIAKSKT